jgi:hypothetical protein
MKKEMINRNATKEVKAGLTAATLPGWARILIAEHSKVSFPAARPLHVLHHCADCGCTMILTSTAYQIAPDFCPECSTKKQRSQGGN